MLFVFEGVRYSLSLYVLISVQMHCQLHRGEESSVYLHPHPGPPQLAYLVSVEHVYSHMYVLLYSSRVSAVWCRVQPVGIAERETIMNSKASPKHCFRLEFYSHFYLGEINIGEMYKQVYIPEVL